MRRATIIGVATFLIVVSVVYGIASLPDEVLSESVSSDITTNVPLPPNIQFDSTNEQAKVTEKEVEVLKNQIALMKTELDSLKTQSTGLNSEQSMLEPEPFALEDEPADIKEDKEGKVIRVEINDGVGGADV